MKRFAAAWLLSLFIANGVGREAGAQGQDQIVPLRGSSASGIIVATSPTEVTIESRGSQRRFAVNEIRRVSFADDTAEFRRAREDILTGQLENGLNALKQIDPAGIERDLVKQDLQYYIAYCQGKLALSGGGDKGAAVTAMLGFVRTHRQSYHTFEAAELLGDLAVALGSYDNALTYYGVLGKSEWPEYKMRAALLEAGALIAQGKYSEAQEKYQGVQAQSVDSPEAVRMKLLAQVGSTVCLAETGKAEDGVAVLENIIAKNDPQDTELFGRAYNALGRCHLKANRTKEALLAYLHVDILFYASPEVHAEALYHLAKLWAEVNKSDRAVNARNLLLERYAGSVWAKRS